ncbi:Modification methylase DpnIIB [compost metagenome]
MHDVWTGPICQGRERVTEPYVDAEGKSRRRSVHPTQKPLWLVEKAVRIFSNPGDLVVDPFAGVLTGPVAAQRHGRRVIGMDLSTKYLTAGTPRLKG